MLLSCANHIRYAPTRDYVKRIRSREGKEDVNSTIVPLVNLIKYSLINSFNDYSYA